MKSVPEGTTLLVPWQDRNGQDGAPGLLVVARRTPRAAGIAVYLFERAPDAANRGLPFDLPRPSTALERFRMSGLPIVQGQWPTLGVHPGFKRGEWPFDEVAWKPLGGTRWFAIRFNDRNCYDEIGRREISEEEARALPTRSIEPVEWPRLLLQRVAAERESTEPVASDRPATPPEA